MKVKKRESTQVYSKGDVK